MHQKLRRRYDKMNQQPENKFTLIELLIVISIIAILTALLLPGFHKAKEKAKTVACMSNMRQIITGISSYSIDNKEYGPVTTQNSSVAGTWQSGRMLYQNGMWCTTTVSGMFAAGKYVSPGVLQCSSWKKPDYTLGGQRVSYNLKNCPQVKNVFFDATYTLRATDITNSYAQINADKKRWGYRMGNYSEGGLLYCSPYTGTYPTFPHEWNFLAGFENGAVRSLQNVSRRAYMKWSGSYGLTNGDQLFYLMQYISGPVKGIANAGMWHDK